MKDVFSYLNFMPQRCTAFHIINHTEIFDRVEYKNDKARKGEKKIFIQNFGPETDGKTACRKTQTKMGVIFKKLEPG